MGAAPLGALGALGALGGLPPLKKKPPCCSPEFYPYRFYKDSLSSFTLTLEKQHDGRQ